jgi:hypothetical protein
MKPENSSQPSQTAASFNPSRLRQMNPVHVLPPCSLKIHVNVLLSSTLRRSSGLSHSVSSRQNQLTPRSRVLPEGLTLPSLMISL